MNRRRLLAMMNAVAIGSAFGADVVCAEPRPFQGVDGLVGPVGGNPDGDLTAIAFSDYKCPYCKQADPQLQRFLDSDGQVRLVYKDWPILSDASVFGARLALVAAYQGRYVDVHRALMGLPGRQSNEIAMLEAVQGAGVDMSRLLADQGKHAAEVAALLKRNAADAARLGLHGVPVFFIGALKVDAGFDAENFRAFATRARAMDRRTKQRSDGDGLQL